LSVDTGLRTTPGLWIAGPQGRAEISPLLLAACLTAVALLGAALVWRASRRARLTQTWGCGRIGQTPRMGYPAPPFAEPLRRVFAELYRPAEDLSVSTHPQSQYFVKSITYTSEVHPWIETAIYEPVLQMAHQVSMRVRRLQAGSAHLYLLYIVVALL